MISITKLSKPILNTIPNEDLDRVCNLRGLSSTAGEFIINSTPQRGYKQYYSEILNNKGEVLGSDNFGIYPDNNRIFDFYMEISKNLRQTKLHLGEILRIKSIIELIENGLNSITLTSKESAVYFHSKYHFKPQIKDFTQRDYTLKAIANDQQKGFEDLSQKAQTILENIKENTSAEAQRGYCKDASKLASEYIENATKPSLEEYKKHPFKFPIDMVLTIKDITDNKTFFNQLIKKHGIDYEI